MKLTEKEMGTLKQLKTALDNSRENLAYLTYLRGIRDRYDLDGDFNVDPDGAITPAAPEPEKE